MRYRDVVLAIAVAANFGQLGTRLLLGPVVPAIIVAFDASKAGIGIVLTGMWAAYALLQFPAGVLGDRYGERRLLVAALSLAGAGSVLLALAPSFVLFAAVALFLGAGTGLYFTVATSLLADRFEDTGRALSLHTAGGSLAGLAVPAAAGYVVVRFGWRPAVLLGAAVTLPVAAAVVWYVRPTPPKRPGLSLRERVDPSALRAVLGRPAVAYTTAIAVVTVFTWQSVASFLPTFLVEYWGFATDRAGFAFGGLFLLSAVAQPAMGTLSDRVGRDGALLASFVVTVAAIVLLFAAPARVLALAAVGLLGLGISWPGVLQARFMDAFGEAERGRDFGLVRTVYMTLGALGSAVTGALADAVGWPVALGLLAALLGAVCASLVANRLFGLGF